MMRPEVLGSAAPALDNCTIALARGGAITVALENVKWARRGDARGTGPGRSEMIVAETEAALHWKCGSCGLQWVDAGRGFHGDRFSECLRCGTHAREGADSKPARRPPTVPAPRTGAPALPRR